MPSCTVKPGISRIHATPHLKTAESATHPVTNIAAYRFAELSDLKPLRQRLMDFCKVRALKGTILLSTEGVNLFVAGKIIAEAFRVSPIKKPRGFVVKFKTRQDYENWRRDQKNPRLW